MVGPSQTPKQQQQQPTGLARYVPEDRPALRQTSHAYLCGIQPGVYELYSYLGSLHTDKAVGEWIGHEQ